MSSIKRDVKKKASPRPEGEKILSRDPAHFSVSVSPRCAGEVLLWFVCHSCEVHLPVVTTPIDNGPDVVEQANSRRIAMV
jgi:hypothetical protein